MKKSIEQIKFEARQKGGRKGGKVKTAKGFSFMDKDRLKKLASKGGKGNKKK
jgi:Stress-induced bacterial acidophilic repeat motif